MEFIECTRIVPKVKMTPYGCILMQMADSPPRWQHEPRQRSMCQECERPVTIGLAPKPIIAAAARALRLR